MTSHVCSASFSIKKDHYESLTCEVIDSQSGESHQFPFRRPQSGAFVTKTTNKPPVNETPEKKTTKSPPEDQKPVTAGAFVTKTTNKPPVNETPEKKTTKSPPEDQKPVTAALLRTFVVCLGSAALLISVVTVNIWTRTKGKETRMEEIMQLDEVVEGDDSVNYVNVGEPSASVSLD
uniref:uncharacterized protein LOC120808285 isoform X3 n=1 Tax=Gasterosteus aculeatus aculeatus TaxID=481459 RepID=UPI001A993EFF|nr:uncharacterized protein LOC120808285 isoform X3 [Gasterosteus aculeatus aculeatus]